MKVVKEIVISFGLIGATAFAESSEQAYMKSYAGVTDMPVPIKVVSPDITTVRGAEVILEFVINENGVPQAIAVAKSNDSELAEAAMKAVAEWRFTPFLKDGEVVSSKVRLPVVADLPDFANGRFALN